MYTYVLLVFLILSVAIALFFTGNDYFFPSVIVITVFLLSTIFAIIEIEKWHVYISYKTFNIITLGISVYMCVSLIVYYIYKTQKKQKIFSIVQYKSDGNKDRCIVTDIDNVIIIIMDIFACVIAFKYISDVKKSVGGEYLSFSDLAYKYRIAFTTNRLKEGLSRLSEHGYLFIYALSFVLLYIIIINFMCETKKNIVWFFLRIIPISCFLLCTLFAGSRGPILQLFIGGVIIFYILFRTKTDKRGKFQLKTMAKILAVTFFALYTFVWLKDLLGRVSNYSFLDYLAEYIGAPIKNLDIFVNSETHNTSGIWGRETFASIWKTIGWMTGKDELSNIILYKEFNVYNGMSLGNVYTSFREYYYDFGIAGVILLTAFHSLLYSVYYLKLQKNKFTFYVHKISPGLLIYSYIGVALFYYSIDDRFYVAYSSTSNIETMVFIFLISTLMGKIKINYNKYKKSHDIKK